MIDFTTVKSLTIPEGNVVKITDAAGNVLWQKASAAVILQVSKVTSDTYAAETTYEDEEFILLDIYPKSGGTVTVTYGGLTKTITDDGTAETPNAQQVYFGTFNGVADSVETPASGTLTIEGDYTAFGAGTYNKTSKMSTNCSCITAVENWGEVATIQDNAFFGCTGLTSVEIPGSVTSIGNYAFYGCTGLTSVEIPGSVTSIGNYAFSGCTGLTNIAFNEGLESIGDYAFLTEGSNGDTDIETLEIIRNYVLPGTITKIGNNAFIHSQSYTGYGGGCVDVLNCETLMLAATTPPSISYTEDTAGDNHGLERCFYVKEKTIYPKIVVPAGCADAYKAADGWSTFAAYYDIVEVS